MAFGWRASGSTNAELVDNLNRQGLFKSERIKEAMLAVDRGDFAPANPYMDAPISIGYSATISAPHMHATALHYLEDVIKNDSRILDVGSSSGYLVACFAKMIGPKGKVVGIEHIPQLVQLSINNLKKNHATLLENGVVKIIEGDGRLGYEQDAPYDAIHVGAAAPEIPSKLLDQLAVGGRMVIPVGRDNQEFLQIDKISEDKLVKKRLMGVIYVPLTSKEEQIGHRRIQYV
uniref:Protein-L-isoaspartate O-methyltransferase n=1 Tax=Acrobeloides nanus TaxID=290746 RepID=A0A914CMD3_9BILA